MRRRRNVERANRTTRLFLQKQKRGYIANSFGTPKPEDRMKFQTRKGLGQ